MVVNFYQNKSAVNVLSKTIVQTATGQCDIKNDCDIYNPTIIAYDLPVLTSNYMYIPDFSRYYFIENITTLNEKTLAISGAVDVLMSFKTDILNGTGIIERNEKNFTKYIQDSKYTVLSYERVQTKQFPNSFPTTGQFILVVAGS